MKAIRFQTKDTTMTTKTVGENLDEMNAIKAEMDKAPTKDAVKKVVKKAIKAKKAKKVAEPKIKLGAFAVQLMLKGKTNEQVLKETKKRFPKSKVSENSIAWYRSTARKDGLKIKTDRELTTK